MIAQSTLQSEGLFKLKQPLDQYFSTRGMQNANVFPDPVKSLAMTSVPE